MSEEKKKHLGLGVMINALLGNDDSSKICSAAIGKIITELSIHENALWFTFSDGSKINFYDDGQSCCEHRYMHTDDDLKYYIGATLLGAAIKDGPTESDEWGDPKESEFLIIKTSEGEFTVVNYNEHNGYYGGFSICCKGDIK